MKHLAWTLVLFIGCGSGNPPTGFTQKNAQGGAAGTAGAGQAGSGGASAGAKSTGGSAGASAGTTSAGGSKAGTGGGSGAGGSGAMGGSGATGGSGGTAASGAGGSVDNGGSGGAAGGASCGAGCPTGYTCGTANGMPVCRAASGIPLFNNVFLVLMENTSQSTLAAAIKNGGAPNIGAIVAANASGANYHGVAHPSLPNYVALTSGDTQGIACDCEAAPNKGMCNLVSCSKVLGNCTCTQSVQNLADQIETAGLTWTAFGESMGSPCNLTDSGNYAVRHVPFLYYDDIQSDSARCTSHVIDMSMLDLSHPPAFTYIAPNLVDDMHNPPFPQSGPKNIANGDAFLGPAVAQITATPAYMNGGLLVVVWDEDDDSGGVLGSDDPIPIFVLSPYANAGGYVSQPKCDHYTLLATIEDGLGLPRLGKAGTMRSGIADTLSDYFPAQ